VCTLNRFFTNKKIIIILISILIFISLLTLSIRQKNTNIVQGFTNDITAFVNKTFSRPINALIDTYDTASNVQNTFEENKRLKSELDRLYEVQSENEVVRDENQQLQEELDFQNSITEYQTTSGNVIVRNPDNWIDQITIDRGSQDGVQMNMPVMSGNGLIGQISEVNLTSSKVTLLTNSEETANQVSSEVTGENENGGSQVVHGLISSYDVDEQMLVMTQITSDAEISEGETVTTSGLGGAFPRGLVIGTVQQVTLDDQGLTQRIYVEPAADFNNTRAVSIIDREAETIDIQEEAEEEEEQ